jgi:glycosyltransferase involved in cell wall biosynthesis
LCVSFGGGKPHGKVSRDEPLCGVRLAHAACEELDLKKKTPSLPVSPVVEYGAVLDQTIGLGQSQLTSVSTGPSPFVITIVCNDAHYFNRHRRIIADRLAKMGADVHVIAGGDPLAILAPHFWSFRSVRIERFGLSLRADWSLFRATLSEVFRRRPQVLHLITLKPALVGGLAGVLARVIVRAPERIVILIAGLGRLMSPQSKLHGRHTLSRLITKSVIGWLSRRKGVSFVFETESDRAIWLSQGLVLDSNSEVVMGAGVDDTEFYPGPGPRNHGPVRILFAARLLAEKGLDVYLEAAQHFEARTDVEFLVAAVNEPVWQEAIGVERLRSSSAITFLGEVSDMPALLRSVDLVCLPSRYGEGIPRILIEAAACGLPSIASDLPGCRKIVTDEQSGFIVPFGPPQISVAALISAIERYLANPGLLRRHGEAALKTFRSEGFDAESIVARFVSLLKVAS